jgi:hypothetical protein
MIPTTNLKLRSCSEKRNVNVEPKTTSKSRLFPSQKINTTASKELFSRI